MSEQLFPDDDQAAALQYLSPATKRFLFSQPVSAYPTESFSFILLNLSQPTTDDPTTPDELRAQRHC